jgi:hypothetical protein
MMGRQSAQAQLFYSFRLEDHIVFGVLPSSSVLSEGTSQRFNPSFETFSELRPAKVAKSDPFR